MLAWRYRQGQRPVAAGSYLFHGNGLPGGKGADDACLMAIRQIHHKPLQGHLGNSARWLVLLQQEKDTSNEGGQDKAANRFEPGGKRIACWCGERTDGHRGGRKGWFSQVGAQLLFLPEHGQGFVREGTIYMHSFDKPDFLIQIQLVVYVETDQVVVHDRSVAKIFLSC